MDSFRSALQPVMLALPAPIRDAGTALLGASCYETLVLDVDLTHGECLRLATSKALGVGIICASAVVKVPQMLKLLHSRSSEGVSFLAYALETSSYLISLAYNVRGGFPFTTYGETALILGQNVIISALMLRYAGRAASAAMFVAALSVAGAALFSEAAVDSASMAVLQAGAGVLSVASKLPQIVAIWREGGTGQLSAFAVFNYLLGSLSRIFTTLQEVDDRLILYNFVAGFALNLVLALQMVYYWNVPSAKAKGKQKEVLSTPSVPAITATVPETRSTSSSYWDTADPKTTTNRNTTPKARSSSRPTTRRRG